MNRENVTAAIAEAKRFIKAAETLLAAEHPRYYDITRTHGRQRWTGGSDSPKESGAARRASLDLTRALAEMRKS